MVNYIDDAKNDKELSIGLKEFLSVITRVKVFLRMKTKRLDKIDFIGLTAHKRLLRKAENKLSYSLNII